MREKSSNFNSRRMRVLSKILDDFFITPFRLNDNKMRGKKINIKHVDIPTKIRVLIKRGEKICLQGNRWLDSRQCTARINQFAEEKSHKQIYRPLIKTTK